jgi:diketogulonate reductase-like aldo/keto reductase
MAIPAPIFTLNNGITIPSLGFGTFENAKNGTASSSVMHHAVITALEAGYRHLDCAW